MNKKFKKHINIHMDVYETDLVIAYNYSNKELIKIIQNEKEIIKFKRHKKEFVNYLKEDPKSYCGTYMSNDRRHLIRIWSQKTPKDLINTISHEVFHFVRRMLTYRGFTLSPDSEEAYSYLTGYLMGEIYDKLIVDILRHQK